MKERVLLSVFTPILVISSFVFLYTSIRTNTIPFNTDEMYWISTARIIPLLLNKRFNDPTWKEYYGFTNFNGAKYVFGIGLALFGHNEEAIQQARIAPYTYYTWKQYDGTMFPTDHMVFQILIDARIISALFTSCSAGLMVILGYLLFNNVIIACSAGIVLSLHPITTYIGTHAYADSIFLSFILLSLICIIIFFMNLSNTKTRMYVIYIHSFIFAYLISIKINGLLIMFSFIFLLIWLMTTGISRQLIRYYIVVICTTFCLTFVFFLLLHPNLFFFPSYSLLQMLSDRVAITKYHVSLFFIQNPDHVTLSLTQKIHSLITHLAPPWVAPLFIGGALYTGIQAQTSKKKQLPILYIYIILMGCAVLSGTLVYVVFDEQRYFVPLLPFFVLISVSWLSIFKTSFFFRSILKRFSNMRN